MSRIFLTGATGFIGRHLLPRLAAAGHELSCLVRASSDTSALDATGARAVRGALGAREDLARAMEGADQVIHLAGVYSFWERERERYAEVNVEGTRNVMQAALSAGVVKVVHVSTAAVWGRPEVSPFDEDTPVGPERFSEYARTKYLGDCIAWQLHETRGLPLVVIHPGSVLGAGDPKPSGDYVRRLVNGSFPVRAAERGCMTFVHVRDVAEAIALAAEKPDDVGAKYLVGRDCLSVAEMNRIVREIAGVRLPRIAVSDRVARLAAGAITWLADVSGREPLWGFTTDQILTASQGFRFDGSRAEKELGLRYTPVRVAFEEMIADLLRD